MSEPIVIVAASAAGKPIVEKLFVKLWGWISKPVTLPFKCRSNVQDLKEKVAELEGKKISMEKSKQDAERSGKEVDNEFQKWLNDAGNLIDAANEEVVLVAEEKAKNKCFYRFGGLCLHLVSRYKLSKKAEQNSVSIDQQISKASNYYPLPIAHPPSPVRETDSGGKSFEEFPSRGGVLNQIMEELRGGTTVNRIGIHGMAGAGKTTLVKEVKRRAEEEQLFVKVVLAKVTHKPDMKSIREEIARGLGLDSLPKRLTSRQTADRIKARLIKEMAEGNVLVILDDIWTSIDLEDVGIPLKETETDPSGGNCEKLKILMTSRDCNVLEIQMSSHLNFPIGDLQYEEAWRLFEKIVGDKANDPELQPTAIGIVEECGGLPLAVATLAFTLRKGISHEWNTMLAKLKNPSPDNFTGVHKAVYTAIQVSYNQLENEKLKQIFLLCCMVCRNASIERLLRVGVGLGLFSRANTLEDARNELLTLVGNLKAASLLIDGYRDGRLDMHDLIHDVAIAIASKDRQGLLVSNNQELEELSDLEAANGFNWIIVDCVDISVLPDELEASQLTLFHMHNKDQSLIIPEIFFKRMQKLRVLALSGMHLPSICLPRNVHTLYLIQSGLRDIRTIGHLESLEILFLTESEFEELPTEIGKLKCLKVLDLRGCHNLKIIQPRVLESLSRLEELYLPNIFDQWKIEGQEDQGNPSLSELMHLKKLTTLEIHVGDMQMIPQDFLLVNLKRYKMIIGDVKGFNRTIYSRISKLLKLNADMNLCQFIEHPIKPLLKTAEGLYLQKLNGVQNVVDDLDTEGFRNLKYLYIQDAPDVQQIVKAHEEVLAFPTLEVLSLLCLTNLENMFQGSRFQETSFNKLTKVIVNSCGHLKSLFTSSTARRLFHLQELEVSDCESIEDIVVEDMEQVNANDIVEEIEAVKPKFMEHLRILKLKKLPKLVSFNSSCRSKPIFNDQVAFPNLEELELRDLNISRIWHTMSFINASSFVENLVKLTISFCECLEDIFSSSMVKGLVKLKRLRIASCDRMKKVVVSENEEEMEKLIFPKLEFLELTCLPEVVGFYIGNSSVEFPSLKKLEIMKCPKIKGFTMKPKTTSTEDRADIYTLFTEQARFPELSSLTIKNCDFLEEIIGSPKHSTIQTHYPISTQPSSGDNDDDDEIEDGIVFDKLKHLELYYLKRLKSFCSLECKIVFPSLEKAIVIGCPRMQLFSMGESVTPRLQKVDWTYNPNDEGSLITKCDLNSTIHLMFLNKVGYSRLQTLELAEFPELIAIWNEDPQDILSFRMLTKLTVCNISGLMYLLTPSMASDLVNLKELEVSSCDAMEQVITGADPQEIIFPKLSNLKLVDLPKLTKFCSEHYLGFPCLRRIKIDKCPLLKTFVQSSEKDKGTNAPALFDKKVRFPRLCLMTIDSLGSISKIWEEQLDVEAFCKLQFLFVMSCENLLSVFPLNTLERLQGLKRLSIRDCSSLTEVFEFHGASQLQVWTATDPTFVDMEYFTFKFPILKRLTLSSLAKLKFFFPKVHTIECPLLTKLEVEGCNEVQIFASECPRVQSMTRDDQLESLNPCPLFWVNKATFPSLEELRLGWSDMFKEIWCSGQHPGDYFPKLQLIELSNYPERSVQLPSVFFQSLPNLEELVVNDVNREISQKDKANSFRQGQDSDSQDGSADGSEEDIIVGCSKDVDASSEDDINQ